MPKATQQVEQGAQLEHRVVVPEGGLERALHSVVKVYVTTMEADYRSPWQNYMQEEVTGSGFAVCEEGKMVLLTNAHVVTSYTGVRVRKFGQVTKVKARVLLIAQTADLALLAVDDDEFWKDMIPLELGEVPRLYSNVAVVGYPFGGESGCVTRGVVSRVDTTTYVRGAEALLVVQIDAAINAGNSGGPALDDDFKVAGVAFSGYAGSADNIGFVIPKSVIKNVLFDWLSSSDKKGKWGGLCNLGATTQTCENPALRRRLKAMDKKKDRSGVLVTRVAALGCAAKAGLVAGDMILSIDSFQVANDGTVPLRKSERVHFDHCVTSKRRGDLLDLVILRKGRELTLKVTLAALPRLVPLLDGFDASPSYVIIAGLVFMPLSVPLIAAVCDDDEDSDDEDTDATNLHYLRDVFDKDKPDQDTQIVTWTQTLSHDCNFGYEKLCQKLPRLHKFNSVPVKNLAHLAYLAGLSSNNNHNRRKKTTQYGKYSNAAFTSSSSSASKKTATAPPRTTKNAEEALEFYEFEFLSAHSSATEPTIVVIDRKEADEAQGGILRRAKVPSAMSQDLRAPLRAFANKEKPENQDDDDETTVTSRGGGATTVFTTGEVTLVTGGGDQQRPGSSSTGAASGGGDQQQRRRRSSARSSKKPTDDDDNGGAAAVSPSTTKKPPAAA